MRFLANFVDNASKYADGATGVFVERHEQGATPDPAGVDDALDGPTVRIAVEDRGPGVPEGERQRVFHRFNRGDQGGSRGKDVGVGLGLALAAEHARLQGGRVWVEDRDDGGQGARFVVELPLVQGRDDEGQGNLSEVTQEDADTFALTGEMPAVRIDVDPERTS